MGGSSVDDEWVFTSPSNDVRTLVLVGRTGNGKSATGNSILQRNAFESSLSSAGVTSTWELQMAVSKDGQIVNVIDTPGLFDLFAESEFIGKEIVRCINMAKDGIHAALLVLSIKSRFTEEEEAAIQSLQNFFGSKIYDYMIVVFTGGDELEKNKLTLEDYLGRNCPEPLQETLNLCGNRRVLFDNRTEDEKKMAGQVQELLYLVNKVLEKNGGKPYTNELFIELKVESKLKERTRRLEQQLAQEHAARLEAEESVKFAQMRSDEEIRKLRENLEKAQRETEEFRRRAESGNSASFLRENLEKAQREAEERRRVEEFRWRQRL